MRAGLKALRHRASSQADRRQSRAGVFAIATVSLAALLLPVLHRPPLRLIWNASASVPLGLYRVDPGTRPSVGEIVAIRPSVALTRYMARRRYVEAGALLIKPVAALTGATVCRAGLKITIDGHAVAAALPHDQFGRPLPRWSGCMHLGADRIFLIAPATAASFDSRYFGSVHTAQVIGRVTPLWTWS